MPTSPLDLLRDVNPDAIPADAPPAAANYRSADVQGIVCASCVKFVFTGEGQDEQGEPIPLGYCSQWEANVRGDFVSDAFADSGPALDENGEEIWDFADSDRTFAEIHLTGSDASEEKGSGFVIKEVLRTGEWPAIPTKDGIIKKPLRIVRDGKSDKAAGVISLSELAENFKAGAIESPQIPLSDDDNDHKNITRLNTGFVRDLWIVDEGDTSKLVAKMEFTEPEVREKVLRGTYADVSCGIPWRVVSRGKEYGSAVEHVAITNRPFIDGLGPFLAASDKQEVQIAHFGQQTEQQAEESSVALSFRQILEGANAALIEQLSLSADYRATDVVASNVTIQHGISNTSWTAPFTIDGEQIKLAATREWTIEEGENDEPSAQNGSSPTSASEVPDELEQARRLRGLRLSQQPSDKREKEGHMPLTREELGRLDLSDDARAALQSILDENDSLRATTRESEADRRVTELSDLGIKERPGFLKFYRSVMLSDDGGPAVVLLSENGQSREQLTALEVLDRAIEALKGSDGKVVLSDQQLASGNDDPPPASAEGENQKSVAERKAEVEAELYGRRKK